MIVMDELGMIRENLDESPAEREEREMTEAIAMSLSLAPLETDVQTRDSQAHRFKAHPPLPPTHARPSPPDEVPSSSARREAIARLPTIFPPVGHAWNQSALATRAQRPPRRRRRPRIWPASPERIAYFPPNGPGYARLRSRRHMPAPVVSESNTDTGESRGDAPSVISTAPSRYNSDLRDQPPPLPTILWVFKSIIRDFSVSMIWFF